jgi:hypothetical protein
VTPLEQAAIDAARYVRDEFWQVNGADGSGGYDAQKALRAALLALDAAPAQRGGGFDPHFCAVCDSLGWAQNSGLHVYVQPHWWCSRHAPSAPPQPTERSET